jgi:hypothetical protein
MSLKDATSYLTASGQFLAPNGTTVNIAPVEGGAKGSAKLVEPHIWRHRFVESIVEVVDTVKGMTAHPYQPSIRTSRRSSRTSNDGKDEIPVGATLSINTAGLPPPPEVKRPSLMSNMADGLRRLSSGSIIVDVDDNTEEILAKCSATIGGLAGQILDSQVAEDEYVKALIVDIQGQATEALSKMEFYRKWGRHYLPSLMFAHSTQQCNNFKDPGVQFYGGALFDEIRTIAEDIFDKLPAPKPTCARRSGLAAGSYAPINMAAYNDRFAGCIHGACLVRLANGMECCVEDLSKGDKVVAPGDVTAEVVCVVSMRCPAGLVRLVELPGGARLTPYHPVYINGAWRFPCDVSVPEEENCEMVYNLVLAGAPSLLVGDLPCVALGHGIEEGAAQHSYFGSVEVVNDIAKFSGFDAGHVELSPENVLRDPESGLVCGLRA